MSVLVVASTVARAAVLVRWTTHFGSDESNLRWWAYSLAGGDEETSELEGLEVEVLNATGSDPVDAVLDLVREHEPNLLVVEGNGNLPTSDPLWRLGDRLLRFAACDVMVLDPGASEREYCERVVVPMERPFGAFAMSAATRIAGRKGIVRPLVIGSRIGHDAEAVATKGLELDMGEAGIEESESIQPVVVLADRRLAGLCEAGANADLLLIGASAPHLLSELRASGHLPDRIAVGLVRSGKSPTENRWKWLRERLIDWLPTLRPEERIDLYDRLQAGARWSVDFLVMVGLSSALATLGLLQGSTAVVIGAMVVAPLMTPLIGAGLALVQGNRNLFLGSIKAMSYGVGVSLLVSILITLIAPIGDLTTEVMARGMPTILDLAVAYLSGFAAAYALARPNVIAALAGVAIAAALVPPLTSVGIALATGHFYVAEGAAILFITNLVMIILGAAVTFLCVGVQGTRVGFGVPLWGRRTLIGLTLASVILVAPLGYRTAESLAQGQIRPMAYPLSSRLGKQVRDRVREEPNVSLILAGRTGIDYGENDIDVGMLLSSTGPVSAKLRDDLIEMVQEVRGRETKVAIRVVSEISFVPVAEPIEEPDE